MNKPDISIIMLTYNREGFLSRSIEAVLAQRNCNFEFVIVNNGSTDESLEICQQYAKIDKRIKLVNKSNGNIGAGRNAGIDIAIGDFISFVDDDDYMDNDMFEYLYHNAKEYDADISICGCYSDFGDKLEIYYVYNETFVLDKIQGIDELLKREIYNSANPCKLFKRSLFKDIRYLPIGKYDDIHTIYKLFANSNRTIATGIPKYFFTKHNQNNSNFVITNQLTTEQLTEYLRAFKERTKYLSEKVPGIRERVRYSEFSYMISMIDKIVRNNLINCYNILSFMKEQLNENMLEFFSSVYLTAREKDLLKKYFNS